MIDVFTFIGEDEEHEDRLLGDGIYSVDVYTEFITGDERTNKNEIETFQRKYPEWVVAWPYETGYFILLSRRPSKYCNGGWEGWRGSGFNYGSCNIIDMQRFKDGNNRWLLILAQND